MEYTLITGATSGIGFEIAKLMAKDGNDLILVSSNMENLKKTKEKIQKKFPVNVFVFQKDLSKNGSGLELYNEIEEKDLTVTTLVNNAGFGFIGENTNLDFQKDMDSININVCALTELTKLYLKDMYNLGTGKILNVASIGAFQPGPYTATYYATKAFVLSYTRALHHEAKASGIKISALCPGTTRTLFFAKAGSSTPRLAMSPKRVAKIAIKGLNNNKEIIVPGFVNKIIRFVPTKIKIKALEKIKNND